MFQQIPSHTVTSCIISLFRSTTNAGTDLWPGYLNMRVWSTSALRLKRDSLLEITFFHPVALEKSNRHYLWCGVNDRSFKEVRFLYQSRPVVSESFPLIPSDAWKVVNSIKSMLPALLCRSGHYCNCAHLCS